MQRYRISIARRFCLAVLACMPLIIFNSCQRNSSELERVTVRLQAPSAAALSFQEDAYSKSILYSDVSVKDVSTMDFGLADPVSLSEFNCFAVMVEYPEVDTGNVCGFEGSGEVLAPDELAGLVGAGQTLEMSVIAGAERAFHLVGFKSTLASCPDVNSNFDNIEASLSNPFRLGVTFSEISAGAENIVTISGLFDSNFKFADCNGPLFDIDADKFDPLSISGLHVWYDAADTSTITHTANSVDNWADKSGNGFNAVGGGGTRPITNSATLNGNNVLFFDGTDDRLITTAPGASSATIFAVALPNAITRFIIGANDSTGLNASMLGVDATPAVHLRSPNFGSSLTGTTTITLSSNYHIFTASHSGAGRQVFFDTVLENSDGTSAFGGSTTPYAIGARNDNGTPALFWDGQIAEIIIYDFVLSAAQREKVHNYLKQKWGI